MTALERNRDKTLVERVAIALRPMCSHLAETDSRTAILEVSKWLTEQSNSVTGLAWAAQLEIEATTINQED